MPLPAQARVALFERETELPLQITVGSSKAAGVCIPGAPPLAALVILSSGQPYALLKSLGTELKVNGKALPAGTGSVYPGAGSVYPGDEVTCGGQLLFRYAGGLILQVPAHKPRGPSEGKPTDIRPLNFVYLSDGSIAYACEVEHPEAVEGLHHERAEALVQKNRAWVAPWHEACRGNTRKGFEIRGPADTPSPEAIDLIQSLPPGTMLPEVVEALAESGIELTLKGVVAAYVSKAQKT